MSAKQPSSVFLKRVEEALETQDQRVKLLALEVLFECFICQAGCLQHRITTGCE